MMSEARCQLPYAEDVPYWKTGSSSPEKWIQGACRQIESIGGRVEHEAFASNAYQGSAYCLVFFVDGEQYRIVWPVLPTKRPGDALAARRQAATFLFHDVKAKCMSSLVLGARAAFMPWRALPDGRPACFATFGEVRATFPALPLPPPDGGPR
ncbi:MAG TPA: hypothetical protein VMZ50_06940 [Phycisphaerae bacterium]|nr:hypothetical protein [Phycisphaerae bacterium]HUX16879.1 hypothetical protein [Phycisphaerae bacterium]